MEPTSTIAEGLSSNPLAYLCALLLAAVVWLSTQLKASLELRIQEAKSHGEALVAVSAESSKLSWELANLLKNIDRFGARDA